jgi:hypothetical protein
MGKNLMITKVYYTHTTDDGYIFDARPMPEEFISRYGKSSTGTPVRVFIIDTNEERKFKTIPNDFGVFLSDEGEQGYIGYFDYQIEDDKNITYYALYIHPFHRNKDIARKVFLHTESICEEGTVFNNGSISSAYLYSIVDEINARNKVTILMENQREKDNQ